MNESGINKIARKLVMASGNNVFDDFFAFYSDGQWVVQICRKLIQTLNVLKTNINNYNTNIPVIDEYIQYLQDVKLDDMNTNESVKQIKSQIKNIKKIYLDFLEEQDELKKNKENEKYIQSIKKLIQFMIVYERSCVNIFKNRYVQDESNVYNLLSVIRQNGNKVILIKENKK